MSELILAALLFSFSLSLNLPGCHWTLSTARPVPVIQLQPAPLGVPFDPSATWRPIADDDLLARMILSETGGRVLTDHGQVDSVGMVWVALNRTRGLHSGFDYASGNLHSALTRPGQFQGIAGTQPGRQGNAALVADPEAHDEWFGVWPGAGRAAYWVALAIARCTLSGRMPDPTRGALFFSDARYKLDEAGHPLRGSDGGWLTEPWPDGRTHFRPSLVSSSYAIDLPGVAILPKDGRRR